MQIWHEKDIEILSTVRFSEIIILLAISRMTVLTYVQFLMNSMTIEYNFLPLPKSLTDNVIKSNFYFIIKFSSNPNSIQNI